MKVFLRVVSILIRSSLSFLDTSFPTDADFGTTFPLHFLQAITTGTNKQTEEINLGEFFNGNVNLFGRTLIALLLMIFNGRPEIGVILHSSIDKSYAFIFELLAIANLASIGTTTLTIVRWRRRRGAEKSSQRWGLNKKLRIYIPFAFRGDKVVQP
jgi:hypothetical protein